MVPHRPLSLWGRPSVGTPCCWQGEVLTFPYRQFRGGGGGLGHPSPPPSQHSALPCPWVRLGEGQGGCPEGLFSTRPPSSGSAQPLSAVLVGRAARSARSAPATPCNIGSTGGCKGSAVVTTPLLFPWGLGGRGQSSGQWSGGVEPHPSLRHIGAVPRGAAQGRRPGRVSA